MIEGIKIKSVASFGDEEQVIEGVSQNNFFMALMFWQTTISRLIADEDADDYSKCSVIWRSGNKLETWCITATLLIGTLTQCRT